MRYVLGAVFVLLSNLALGATKVRCLFEYSGEVRQVVLSAESDALGGTWLDLGPFRVRTLLAAPAKRKPWALIEVHAAASANAEYRVVSLQKLTAPFSSGALEVIEPGLGRSLLYRCGRSV